MIQDKTIVFELLESRQSDGRAGFLPVRITDTAGYDLTDTPPAGETIVFFQQDLFPYAKRGSTGFATQNESGAWVVTQAQETTPVLTAVGLDVAPQQIADSSGAS